MTTWVIGDIHGCWQTLLGLLETIEWEPDRDELWLVGDLVNRGPSSLEVLRWASLHDHCLTIVLGNHDLHLLARAANVTRAKSDDTLDEVLAAPDRDLLLDWLRRRPLVHRESPIVLVHAGLVPAWDLAETCRLADAVSARLVSEDGAAFLEQLYARRTTAWRDDLEGEERLAAAAAIFTRARMVGEDGIPRLKYQGAPGDAPGGWRPWFESSEVRRKGGRVIFGHWALLGLHQVPDAVCLDSGCVYGGRLSALCLDDGRVVQESLRD